MTGFARKTAGGIVRRARRAPDQVAEVVCQSLLRRSPGSQPSSPLFILGLPRSGTTLVYQYIVHRKHVSYFTNGVGKHPWRPCLTTYLQTRKNPPYRSDFESHYGRSSGAMAPREAGSLWLRFFDIDAFETIEDVSPRSAAEMRRMVGCIEAIFGGAPFVNKNVKHLLRIDALAKIFPRSSFLRVDRNRVDVALSVLRGRIRYSGGIDEWFSLRPKNYDQLVKLSPVDQIVGQVIAVERQMDEDLARLDPARVHVFGYEDFCERPDVVIDGTPLLAALSDKNPPEEGFSLRRNEAENEMERELVEKMLSAGLEEER